MAQRDDYERLAAWLVQVSQMPGQQCLHTWSGQSVEELREQLQSYWDDSELCYVMALQDGNLVGAMGSEYDEGLGRGWLHGPHVVLGDWDLIATQLFTKLLSELPVCIKQLDSYLPVENDRGRHFYTQQGFKEREHLNYEFCLTPDQRVLPRKSGCMLLGKEQEVSFKQLYKALFPTAYYTGERIIQMIGQSHQVLVLAQREDVFGFVVVSTEGGLSAGEIQFLGVREDCRRQGYGRQLLLSGINWLFDTAGASQVCLNVAEELVYARSLYESVGFRLKYTGIGFEKKLARSENPTAYQSEAD